MIDFLTANINQEDGDGISLDLEDRFADAAIGGLGILVARLLFFSSQSRPGATGRSRWRRDRTGPGRPDLSASNDRGSVDSPAHVDPTYKGA